MEKGFVLFVALIAACGLILLGCSTLSSTSPQTDIPIPKSVNIVPPAPDLPKDIAAFSGKWQDGSNCVYVEEVTPTSAKVIHCSGRTQISPAACTPYVAEIKRVEGSGFVLSFGRAYSFTARKDGILEGTLPRPGLADLIRSDFKRF